MIINRNQQCELDALIKDEPCKKELTCEALGLQDEYFDNKPFKQIKRKSTFDESIILQARKDLIKLGFIKDEKK
jgi:hypothetical protein